MNLFSREGQSSFDRLLRSLTGSIGAPIRKQTAAIGEDQATRLFGTQEEFLR